MILFRGMDGLIFFMENTTHAEIISLSLCKFSLSINCQQLQRLEFETFLI